MFEHPLGLPPLKENPNYRIGGDVCFGTAMAGVDPVLRFPVRRGQHNWMIVVTMPATAEHLLTGAFQFRPHAMADFNAHCWVCERDFTPDIAEGPCLGDPRGLDVPTRAEWRAWTDEEKLRWVERFCEAWGE